MTVTHLKPVLKTQHHPMRRWQPSQGLQNLLALISQPTLTWAHCDPRAVRLTVNVVCFHGAWESVLNAALIINNWATTHGVGVKNLQTAGNGFNKGENNIEKSVKTSDFHLSWTNQSVGRSRWIIMPLALPRGLPTALWGPQSQKAQAQAGSQPMLA